MQRAKFRNLCRDKWRFFMLRFSKHPPIKAKPKTCDDPKKKKSWNRSETDFHFSKREAPFLVLIVFNCHTFPVFHLLVFFSFLFFFSRRKRPFSICLVSPSVSSASRKSVVHKKLWPEVSRPKKWTRFEFSQIWVTVYNAYTYLFSPA